MNKYKKGKQIESISELSDILARNEYIFWNNRPKHPAWIMSMQYRNLYDLIKSKRFFVAERNE